jgi:glycerol-3-phosphate dehydrogenase (NAD(P)+)
VGKSYQNTTVGVIGAGSFGSAIANLLAENCDVIVFSRRENVVAQINAESKNGTISMHPRVKATNSMEEITNKCLLLYPVIPSADFRKVIRSFAPFLRPDHIMIHGTKGLDIHALKGEELSAKTAIPKEKVNTMSEIILQETVVKRVGCLAGPNLSAELNQLQPAATVIASHYDEVIRAAQETLRSKRFMVYHSKDITGVELAGVLKNIIAMAAGALSGIGYGENTKALLISRGMVEMIHIGQALGGDARAFFGLAGVGDLIATCSTKQSRNFTVGYRLSQGETIDEIMASMDEVAEGINTLKITKGLINMYKMRAPITETIFKIMNGETTMQKAIEYLMLYPFSVDVDYI